MSTAQAAAGALSGSGAAFGQKPTDTSGTSDKAGAAASGRGDSSFVGKDPEGGFSLPAAFLNASTRIQKALGGGAAGPDKTYGAVPNNSGGGVPGTGASSGSGANLGSARPSSGAAGFPTDIDQGLRSGGYTGNAVSGDGRDPAAWAGRLGAGAGPGDDAGRHGLDLKRYLPGGGAGVGGLQQRHADILGSAEDIWQHVSVRMTTHCRLGLLVDCK